MDTALNGDKVVSLGAGSSTSFALTDEGEMWGWRKNNVGQMGLRAAKTPKLVPEVVMRSQEMSRIRQVREPLKFDRRVVDSSGSCMNGLSNPLWLMFPG